MLRLSGPAKLVALVVVVATAGSEIAATVVYRHSTDGQTPVLWMFIVLYGLLALGVIKLIDGTLHRVRRRTPRL